MLHVHILLTKPSRENRFKGDEGAEDLNVFIANIKAEITARINRPVEVKKEEEK